MPPRQRKSIENIGNKAIRDIAISHSFLAAPARGIVLNSGGILGGTICVA